MSENENRTQAQLKQAALKAARTLVGNTYQPNENDDHYRITIKDWERLADALNAAGVEAEEGDNG